jgi:hypothetical protein
MVEDGGNMALQNIGIQPPHYMVQHPRKSWILSLPSWKPQFCICYFIQLLLMWYDFQNVPFRYKCYHTVCICHIKTIYSAYFIHYAYWFILATGWTIRFLGFDSQWGLGIFLFTTMSRMALGPTQLPIPWVPAALSLEVKRPRREADHSPPSSSEVQNVWSYTSTPQYFMAWCIVKHRDNFIFTVQTLSYFKFTN